MQGKLVVLEGCDGCGKSTQLRLLGNRLDEMGRQYHMLSYPKYDSPASAPLKMYLAGQFGADPAAVNPYAASSFYAVDRIADYLANWKIPYSRGELFISGRYTTSNAVHQGAKLSGSEREKYIDWLFDYEYGLLGLPRPDLVIFLDIPVPVALENIKKRGESRDIHETGEYIAKSRESALFAAARCGWRVINCASGDTMRPPQEILDDILREMQLNNLC